MHLVEGCRLLNAENVWVHGLNVVQVGENERLVHVESTGNDVLSVLPSKVVVVVQAITCKRKRECKRSGSRECKREFKRGEKRQCEREERPVCDFVQYKTHTSRKQVN